MPKDLKRKKWNDSTDNVITIMCDGKSIWKKVFLFNSVGQEYKPVDSFTIKGLPKHKQLYVEAYILEESDL